VGCMMLIENDDSSTGKVSRHIVSKLNKALFNTSSTGTAVPKENIAFGNRTALANTMIKAMKDGFKSGRSTPFYANSDDLINVVEFMGPDFISEQALRSVLVQGGEPQFITIPFKGGGAEYEVVLKVSGRILNVSC
ncbi:MAG: hypothetical protein KF690_07345, partial [Bacteroidetes bacterium]|nr:hypothetical protein [Bacteroidota bacterium]